MSYKPEMGIPLETCREHDEQLNVCGARHYSWSAPGSKPKAGIPLEACKEISPGRRPGNPEAQ